MGEPGYLEKALAAIRTYIVVWLIFSGLFIVGLYWTVSQIFAFNPIMTTGIVAGIWIVIAIVLGSLMAKQVLLPLKYLAQAILHVSPTPVAIAPPDLEKLTLGKELISNLVRQVYGYAARGGGLEQVAGTPAGVSLQQLPIGVMGLDAEARITYANPKAKEYSHSPTDIVGKDFYSLFDILFREQTLVDWVAECETNAVTAQKFWRGIRMNPFGEKTQYFDLCARYNKTLEKDKTQVVITVFDQNEVYGAEEKGLSFIALAVHELRTPLTILRGYIEVFQDEVKEGSIKPELAVFVKKMQVSSENLAAFVNNILNVAKIEENQLTLKLHEENWSDVLTKIIANLKLRTEVSGKKIELEIAPGLPTVGIDRISIAEVITNLIDNSIKYSPPDKTLIKVRTYLTKDGFVETIVQDFGLGVPTQVMPHLFEKFSRNYRNKNNIIGSGLGLYLSKALITAHSGNIWVRSKEGEGSEFGFTIMPFARLSEEEKSGVNKEVTRNAHGWIKNHSLSRR